MVVESTESAVDIDNDSNYSQILRAGRKSQMRRFRGKESIFKRPEGPAPRALSRNIPDFHKNPHKWKKYSLDDVSNDDMTEESNTRAALSFLKELKARKSLEKVQESMEMDVDQSSSGKRSQAKITFKSKKQKTSEDVEFKKPRNNADKTGNTPVVIETDNKPVFRSSKIIMPEYVVGQKKKKKIKRDVHPVKVDRAKQLRLDHLEEPDEEEN
ncbi:hypothetical protein WN51_09795 [Melipona quadrifasciata]|uniref:U5 small nuclear ribonucleoprotein TSSC4 n=1 Tax=Melipona quadrifasciata TaxID=166423 RepID=A0A0N0U6D0_9HYME|nr:hypothetical protein WN51_09795 [Melipona quadrifasciata]